ncbi:reverse transcriptase domain-containing protein [Tanacetum coccineum]
MDAMTMKMDARYKEFQSRSKQPNPDHNDDDIPMSHEEEAKFMKTFRHTRFYNDYRDRDSNRDNWRSSGRNDYNRDNYKSNSDDKPELQKQLSDFIKAQHSNNSFVKETFIDLKTKLETTTKNHQASIQNLKAKFDRLTDKKFGRPSRYLPSNTQPYPKGMSNYGKFHKELVSNKHKLEQISAAFLSNESSALIQNKVPPKFGDPESFLIPCNFNKAFSCDALANLGASINLLPCSLCAKLSLENIKPTKMSVRLADRSFQYSVGIAENMLVEVGKFTFPIDFVILEMEEDKEDFDALLDEENSESESDTEEPPFEKITFNTDYKIKTSFEESPTDIELKPLPDNLEYVFLEEPSFLPVIISSQLSKENKNKLIYVLKRNKQPFS